jgi:hypothetical protein
MCVIVKNMLFLSTNRLHFRERISLMKKRYFQRIWRIMLFLYLYQINIMLDLIVTFKDFYNYSSFQNVLFTEFNHLAKYFRIFE